MTAAAVTSGSSVPLYSDQKLLQMEDVMLPEAKKATRRREQGLKYRNRLSKKRKKKHEKMEMHNMRENEEK